MVFIAIRNCFRPTRYKIGDFFSIYGASIVSHISHNSSKDPYGISAEITPAISSEHLPVY